MNNQENEVSNPEGTAPTSALLVGLPTSDLERITFILRQMGWELQICAGTAETQDALEKRAFDVIVIDTAHAEVAALKLIETVRAEASLSRAATVLVIERTSSENLRRELTRAGVDLIVGHSQEPMYFLPELLSAAFERLRVLSHGVVRSETSTK